MTVLTRFEESDAWQRGRRFVSSIYTVSGQRPFKMDFALRDQIRKAAISVPSNIAEGFERYGPRELQHFLSIARGSCAEIRTQLYLAYDLAYITEDQLKTYLEEGEKLGRSIANFRSSIRTE